MSKIGLFFCEITSRTMVVGGRGLEAERDHEYKTQPLPTGRPGCHVSPEAPDKHLTALSMTSMRNFHHAPACLCLQLLLFFNGC